MKIEFEAYELRGIIDALTPLPAPAPQMPFVPDYASLARNIVAELPERKISAIKIFRSATGWGLRESKDAIEAALGEGSWR